MGITRPTAKYGTLTTSTLARSGEKGVAAMPRIYYAITGIGWGRGSTPSEALENYLSAQRLNFPHLSEDELQEPWGFVWQAPVGTTGFYDSPRGMTWKVDDGVRDWAVPFDPADKVENVGNVPSQFAL